MGGNTSSATSICMTLAKSPEPQFPSKTEIIVMPISRVVRVRGEETKHGTVLGPWYTLSAWNWVEAGGGGQRMSCEGPLGSPSSEVFIKRFSSGQIGAG